MAGAYAILKGVDERESKAWETANKNAVAAKKHAAEVSAEYDNLKTSISSLDSATNKLEELTVGTLEWKEALLQVNNEILGLIEKYPELAKYTSRDEQGVLSISNSGLQML
jgi:hypothetical protein